jgi:hypothetical protein
MTDHDKQIELTMQLLFTQLMQRVRSLEADGIRAIMDLREGMALVKDGEPGPPGEPGRDGRDADPDLIR